MATSKAQRIGIWVIAVVMAVGTIGSFFVIIIANNNSANDQATAQQLYKEYQAKLDKQTSELSDKWFPVLSEFAGRVEPFNAAEVTELATEDLKEGDGAVVEDGTAYSAYYIGWNPDGKIFDQSIDNGKLKAPIPGSGLITGWTEGTKGMKIGGVRLLTIPADKAYGEKGGGELIPPNTPLKFIVLAIPTPEEIPMPDFSKLQF